MDDPAVVARLMASDLGFLLQHDQIKPWASLQELARGREAENSRAHHHDVVSIAHFHALSL